MLSILISLLVTAGVFSGLYFPDALPLGWSITCAVLALVALQVSISIILQRRVKADMTAVQAILVDGQKKLQTKMNRWQMNPPGSVQAAQAEIARDQKVFVKEAIAATTALEKYRLWVPMMNRQIATARLQLYWMIKDFKMVDKLMPKVIIIEPTMAAMKMARLQMLDAPIGDIAKIYKKASARLRYNQNVLLAATYSWILVKRKDVDGAFKVLTEALKNSDNVVLKENHANLMNNRVAHFNNAGIGDQWYALLLEEPKIARVRQRQQWR